MATISAYMRPSRRKEGQLSPCILISHDESTGYLSLGEHIPPTYWSKSKKRAKRWFKRAAASSATYLYRIKR